MELNSPICSVWRGIPGSLGFETGA
jgi:hypothetical protein